VPTYATWNDVPIGEQNWLTGQVDLWEISIGFQSSVSAYQLLWLARDGVFTQKDIGQYLAKNWPAQFSKVFDAMPWAKYGLNKDEYSSAASIYGTEYKKVTGQDISPDALDSAFKNPRDPTGGLLSGSQYQQQLMNDAAIQKQFGWVKYGLDFSAWTQQKLSLRSAFGRDINDAEAATILQYQKAAAGSNLGAVARGTGQQSREPAGVGGSFAR
jgi:hypothetical protein